MVRVLQVLSSDSDLTENLQSLNIAAALLSLVRLLMSLYWRALMRLSSVLSHAQEFRCDELACYPAGPEAALSAFEKFERCMAVEGDFWKLDVRPPLERSAVPLWHAR